MKPRRRPTCLAWCCAPSSSRAGAKFNVTAKDEVLEEDFLSPIYRPLLVLWGITLLGVIAAGISLASVPRRPQHPDDCGAAGRSSTSSSFRPLWARLERRRQRRVVPRVEMNVPAVAAIGAGEHYTFTAATVLDSSTSGCKLKLTPGPDTDLARTGAAGKRARCSTLRPNSRNRRIWKMRCACRWSISAAIRLAWCWVCAMTRNSR